MMDYCTKNADQDAFNSMMLACGLCVEDEEGNVIPSSYLILIDRIGSITLADGTVYPEYYTNIRLLQEPTEAQVTALLSCAIDPTQPQYRVWA